MQKAGLMQKAKKERIDNLLVKRALAPSREKARALIMAAQVLVDGTVVDKAGTAVNSESEIIVKQGLRYVSRGGLKLEGALKELDIDVAGLTILDAGASTGGFTDCALQNGAEKVFALDVGRGLIDSKLRADKRVTLIEGRNVRYLKETELPEKVELALIDVSFISLKKVLAAIRGVVKEGGSILALVKPQFEVGKGQLGKGGIVKDPAKQRGVVEELKGFSEASGLTVLGECESPIKGAKGNREFWLWLRA